MKLGNWRLVFCGVSHKTSTLEQREPLQLGSDEIARANAILGNHAQVLESAIISTCNRIEFYFTTGRNTEPFEVVESFYQELKGLDVSASKDLFQFMKGTDAADQLFRVTAGIDSMVLGENQIMGQVRDAYSSACAIKTAGKVIHRLFHQAFRIGKQVRSDTGMGRGACSVSTAAVGMLKQRIESFNNPRILFVGINKMIELAARRLRQIEGSRLTFANRTSEKAVTFAAKFDARGVGLDELANCLAATDVVISCTSSNSPLITRQMMTEAISKRPGKKLIVMDLAIPRDVDIPKDWNPAVEVHDLEDIKLYVRDQQLQREKAIPQAEEIIGRKLDEFDYWYKHVLHEPIYNGYSNTIESVRQDELGQLFQKLSPELRNELDQVTRRMVNRIIRVASRTASQK